MKAALFVALLFAGSGLAAALPLADPPLPVATRDLDGRIRDAYGLLAPAQPGAPADIAAAWLRDHAAAIGLAPGSALTLQHTRASLTATHLRYQQVLDGQPITGGDISVHVRHDGAIVAAHSRAVEELRPLVDAVSAAQATAIAQGVAAGAPVSTHPVVLARGLEGAPAWEVRFHQPLPLSAWLVHVDRATGEVLAARDTVRAAEAVGQVWVNPIVASRNPDLRDNVLGIQGGPLGFGLEVGPDLGPYLVEVNLTDLSEGPMGPVLAGPFVNLPDAAASGSDLRFPREDPRFEEVQAYYWIDWSQRRIQELGFEDVANYSLPVVSHDQPGVFNAFYRPSGDGTGEVHFGWHAPTGALVGAQPVPNGFADAGEDAEVILHEYGHAILDNQVPNFGSSAEGGGMHEGFGDYWAGTQLSRVSGGWYDHCTAEWFTSYLYVTADGTPPCLRNMENFLTYDYESPDGHLTGQIWSGALWNLRRSLGTEASERLTLEANFFLPVDGGFHAGAEALLVADAALHDAAHARAIVQEFQARNITGLIVTPELLEQVRAADLRVASAEPAAPRPVPGIEAAVLLAAMLGLAAWTRRATGR